VGQEHIEHPGGAPGSPGKGQKSPIVPPHPASQATLGKSVPEYIPKPPVSSQTSIQKIIPPAVTIAGDASIAGVPTGRDSKKASIPIGQELLSRGLISKDQLETALKEQQRQSESRENRKLLGAILVDMGFITDSALGEVLTESSGIKSFSLKKAVLDPKLIKQIPREVALRYKAVPVMVEDGIVRIAIADVYNILAIDQISRYFPSHFKIIPVYSSEADLLEVIDQYYGYETSIGGILREIETGISEKHKEVSGEQEGYVNPTVRLVDAILIDAIKRDASDIHFEPEGAFLRLRYRIDGKLIQIRSFHKDYWPAIAVRIKIMANMNIAETRLPQDGRTSYYVLGRDIDFRVATHPTIFGENIVMRILDKHKALVSMDKLGFSESNERLLKRLLRRPEGIIIVTGPTGSGKTTTLYSILHHINSVDINIMTLENPVEYQLTMLRQSDIKEDKGMDFVAGIRSILRQDPDVIFIGEIRDEATANMAMRAAMTGHKVFSTLHTNDALGAIPRLIDIGIPPYLLAGSLICVMAQRLVRRLCTHCRQEVIANADELRILGLPAGQEVKIFHPKGCQKCFGLGYKGRIAVHEILPVDKGVDELISTGASRKTMLEHLLGKGFISMAQDGVEKVLQGITDIEELIRTVDMTERL
jgi:type IV pilus assembly protein PilB